MVKPIIGGNMRQVKEDADRLGKAAAAVRP
jgi:hypothetical protein